MSEPQRKQGMVDLLTRIGDPAIVFQNLDSCFRGAQSLKGGATEIRFGTEAVTATDIMNNTDERMALILWVKRTDVQVAKDAFKAEVAAPDVQKAGE
jgi:hypothetical protein